MATVTRADGSTEPFDRGKIVRSLTDVGLDRSTALEVASSVRERDAMSTDEIRRSVSSELRARDPALAARYDSARTMPLRVDPRAARGSVCVSDDLMAELGVQAGQSVEVVGEASAARMRVSRSSRHGRRMHMNGLDMRSIGAADGSLVTVKRGG